MRRSDLAVIMCISPVPYKDFPVPDHIAQSMCEHRGYSVFGCGTRRDDRCGPGTAVRRIAPPKNGGPTPLTTIFVANGDLGAGSEYNLSAIVIKVLKFVAISIKRIRHVCAARKGPCGRLPYPLASYVRGIHNNVFDRIGRNLAWIFT